MNQTRQLIDPELCATIIVLLGWALVVMGGLKIGVYLVGEMAPHAWDKIKSPTFKKLLTGKGNRLLFGLGGFLTALFGFGAIGIAWVLRRLDSLF